MLKISKIKERVTRRDGEMEEVFSLAMMVLAYCFQVSVFFALFTTFIFVIASSDMPTRERRAYGLVLFAVVGTCAFAVSMWFIRAVMSMNEAQRKKRGGNGRFAKDVKRGVRVTNGKRESYLVNGKVYSKEELQKLDNGEMG